MKYQGTEILRKNLRAKKFPESEIYKNVNIAQSDVTIGFRQNAFEQQINTKEYIGALLEYGLGLFSYFYSVDAMIHCLQQTMTEFLN